MTISRHIRDASPWTDELVAALKGLAADGCTCSRIASALGHGISRNSVIGKLSRLGIKQRAASAGGRHSQRNRKIAPPIAVAAYKPPEPPLDEPRALLVDGQPVTMEGLQFHSCRWPHGDPCKADFHFCGQNRSGDGPYCAFHHSIAFQPGSATRARSKQAEKDIGVAA